MKIHTAFYRGANDGRKEGSGWKMKRTTFLGLGTRISYVDADVDFMYTYGPDFMRDILAFSIGDRGGFYRDMDRFGCCFDGLWGRRPGRGRIGGL